MKKMGWLEHEDSTDKWWKPPDTDPVHPSINRFKQVHVIEACSKLRSGEVLDVLLHRVTGKDNLIAYPDGSKFSGEEDGIHVNTSGDFLETFKDLDPPIDDLSIVAKVEMESQKQADLVKITNIQIEPPTKENNIFDEINRLEVLSELSANDSKKPSGEIENKSKSDSPVGSVQSESILSGSEKPELPPEPNDDQYTQLYYVATNKAECYHRLRSCDGLENREGELLAVKKEVDGEMPEEISDLRKCHRCG